MTARILSALLDRRRRDTGPAMSQEHIETVKRVYARFAQTGGSDPEDLDRDWEFVLERRAPDPGTHRGEAAVRWLQEWVQSFEDLVIEPDQFVSAGDKVVACVRQRGRVRGGDAIVEGEWWTVHTLREGKVVRFESHPTRAEALEAAGIGDGSAQGE